jgi:hypothetical protein
VGTTERGDYSLLEVVLALGAVYMYMGGLKLASGVGILRFMKLESLWILCARRAR